MDSARVLGAEQVIGIDKEPYRLQMANALATGSSTSAMSMFVPRCWS
jgi:threonine dehydrogenase-like Zn-dependent dehydrogenase